MRWYSMDLLLDIATVITISIYAAIGLRLLSVPSLYKSAGFIATPAEATYLLVFYYAALFLSLIAFFRYKPTAHLLSGKKFTALTVSATAICFAVC
ncbi:hypothetical protein [Anaeroselena agilis]|uniref:Uncharacterized protein n=1 Tax=Anaeroselena agilis TaxID=3063788 RepID=A0ABU3NU10_9FIRM|nr:hypothetical protein [Selenomonadales bacterium 4137-cl]